MRISVPTTKSCKRKGCSLRGGGFLRFGEELATEAKAAQPGNSPYPEDLLVMALHRPAVPGEARIGQGEAQRNHSAGLAAGFAASRAARGSGAFRRAR